MQIIKSIAKTCSFKSAALLPKFAQAHVMRQSSCPTEQRQNTGVGLNKLSDIVQPKECPNTFPVSHLTHFFIGIKYIKYNSLAPSQLPLSSTCCNKMSTTQSALSGGGTPVLPATVTRALTLTEVHRVPMVHTGMLSQNHGGWKGHLGVITSKHLSK